MKIAYHLPQFHPTPENDSYWGEGFTEWTNVKKGRRLFKEHKQPREPEESLGYYNLLSAGVLEKQCQLATDAGINGFCFWHYHFNENCMTLNEVPEKYRNLPNKLPYMYAWVNCDWTGSWIGLDDEIIFKQEYSDRSINRHCDYLADAFCEDAYIKFNGAPLLQIVYPSFGKFKVFLKTLEKRCLQKGLKKPLILVPKLHSTIETFVVLKSLAFNWKLVGWPPGDTFKYTGFYRLKTKLRKLFRNSRFGPIVVRGKDFYTAHLSLENKSMMSDHNYVPTILIGWDNTPRYGRKGVVVHEDDQQFKEYIKGFSELLEGQNKDFVFIKAWNEWAEGNYLEPDKLNSTRKIDTLKQYL